MKPSFILTGLLSALVLPYVSAAPVPEAANNIVARHAHFDSLGVQGGQLHKKEADASPKVAWWRGGGWRRDSDAAAAPLFGPHRGWRVEARLAARRLWRPKQGGWKRSPDAWRWNGGWAVQADE